MARKAGDVFAERFEILRELGEGGNGVVYVVTDRKMGAARALKVLVSQRQADARSRERFERESRAAASLASDHVVRIYDYGVDGDGNPWLCMELLDGATLEDHVREHGPLPAGEARRLVVHLGHALGAAHAQGVLHLDLKPANLFLATPQKVAAERELKVLDFGLAHTIAAERTHAQMTTPTGTPAWMPPEQHNPKAAMRATADVWPLGLIAFWMLTGKQYWKTLDVPDPTDADTMALYIEVAQGASVAATVRARELGVDGRLPEGFDGWFARCLQMTAGDRWPDGAQATRALEELLGRASAAPPSRPSPQPVSVQTTREAPRPQRPAGFTAPVQVASPPAAMSVPPGVPRRGQTEVMPEPPRGIAAPLPGPAGGSRRSALLWGVPVALVAGLGVWWAAASAGHGGPARHDPVPVTPVVDAATPAQSAVPVPAALVCPEGMAAIPAGEFLMGSPEGEGEDDEHPQHRVRVSAFCMDRTEVSVDAYRACLTAGRCTAPIAHSSARGDPDVFCNWGRDGAGNHPVNCVDWTQAGAYCGWKGGGLPTEAQWEYAARGPAERERRYPWGNEAPDGTRANLCGAECVAYGRQHGLPFSGLQGWQDAYGATAPVDALPAGATPEGLLNMGGNVGEWTADWYADHYPAQDATVTDPPGPSSGNYRAHRGGSWGGDDASGVRAASRNGDGSPHRDFVLGFRCARGTRAVDPLVSPQMVRSIQQSLRVEGYPVTARSVRAAVRRVFREPPPRS